MKRMNTKTLSEIVSVAESFQRAMRLDRDFDPDSSKRIISEYVPQRTGIRVLETMCAHIQDSTQRAFTWTGPYGSGKSSLALLLCSLVRGGEARLSALSRLGLAPDHVITHIFGSGSWKIFPITGYQGRLADDLAASFACKPEAHAIVKAFRALGDSIHDDDGVLLIVDELGKYLEADCASENTYLLQELAETANRTGKKTLLVGILHQAIDVYAEKLPQSLRDEWAKVKGRFVDLPLLGSTDEVVELLSRAILSKPHSPNRAFEESVSAVAAEYATYRRSDARHITTLFRQCWPLNPVVTLLLGPISRRSFAQNERSIYSFLGSREPGGFQEFLETHSENDLFSPADYWDYLRSNFEPSILATSDGHRWMTAADAVDRAERVGTIEHVQVAKTLALLDMFRNNTRFEPSLRIIAAAACLDEKKTSALLSDLIEHKVAIEKRFVNAFAVFAGSDFDIEEAVAEAASRQNGLDMAALDSLLKLSPIICRRHYMRTGTLRWFNRIVLPMEELNRWLSQKRNADGATGSFVLLIPDAIDMLASPEQRLIDATASVPERLENGERVIFGIPENGLKLRSLLSDLLALGEVAKRPELEGDETGRREVSARIAMTQDLLASELSTAFSKALWQRSPTRQQRSTRLSSLKSMASAIADQDFQSAPLIRNELVNRDFISANIVAARRTLMKSMITNETLPDIGYTGFPPDYSLFLSLLKVLHRKDKGSGNYRFSTEIKTEQYGDFWEKTDEFLAGSDMVSLKALYEFWRKPPFGLRLGVMPIFALAYLLANKHRIAVYENQTFSPHLTVSILDEWLADPTRIAFRSVEPDATNTAFLKKLALKLNEFVDKPVPPVALDVARAIVRIFFESPKWAQNSTSLSSNTLKLKQTVLKASDPIQLLFRDLPSIYGTHDLDAVAEKFAISMREYLAAMPGLIERIQSLMLEALHADKTDLGDLHRRAIAVKGLSGQLMLEAFIARIEKFSGQRQDIEGLISLGCSKPPMRWTDADIKTAETKLAQLAIDFRKLEAVSALRGRTPARRSFSVVMSNAESDFTESIELSNKDSLEAKRIALQLANSLKNLDFSVAFAALADAAIALANSKGKK